MSNDADASTEAKTTDDEGRKIIPKPEITDEHRERAKKVYASAHDDRPTVVLPGSDNTVSGTAVNDWLDDDGNPKYDENSKESETESQKSDS
jgi:hypothetical protein